MTFIKGIDASSLIFEELNGAVYKDKGINKECLSLLRDYGFNLVRIRIWNDPFSPDGKPYADAPTDYSNYIKLASRAKKLGFKTMLCIQYSDCWADPGKQTMPKKWRGLGLEELCKEVYEYTRNILLDLKSKDLMPDYVAVGNEITNGLLWPVGKKGDFKSITALVNSGLQAVADTDSNIKTMIHLDNGGNKEMYENWFREYIKEGGKDFDVIGLSYYPLWHGHLSDLRENMNNLTDLYDKDMMVVETSYPYTLEDYKEYENLPDSERKGSPVSEKLFQNIDYGISEEGQASYTEDFLKTITSLKKDRCLGFVWWEGELIPVPNSSWATWEGIEYMNEKGPLGNEWATQCLFDFKGNTLKSLKIIRDFNK